MCGPPGSGKSFVAKRLAEKVGAEIVSSDKIRIQFLRNIGHFDVYHPTEVKDATEEFVQRVETKTWNRVFSTLISNIRMFKNNIMDASSIKYEYVKRYSDLAKEYNIPFKVIMMDVPFYACVRRNGLRERMVPYEVLREMYVIFLEHKPRIIHDFDVEIHK